MHVTLALVLGVVGVAAAIPASMVPHYPGMHAGLQVGHSPMLSAMGGVDPYTLGLQQGAALAFKKGQASGFQQGQVQGYVKGKNTGLQKGIQAGYQQGKVQGFHHGKSNGFHKGVSHGFHSGKAQGYHSGKIHGLQKGVKAVSSLQKQMMMAGPYASPVLGMSHLGYGGVYGSSLGYGGGLAAHGGLGGYGGIGGYGGLGVAGGTVRLGVHQPGLYGGGYASLPSSYGTGKGSLYSKLHYRG